MPELPEVETVKRGLAPKMEGARIEKLELRRADLRFPFPIGLSQTVAGRTIEALSRRSKYLLIHLSGDLTLISHLGMSGSYRVVDESAAAMPGEFHHARSKNEKHDHVVFHLKTTKDRIAVIYNDPRRFGFLLSVPTSKLNDHPLIKDLGLEPTGNALTAEYLASSFKGKAQPLKLTLLDQKIIAGLGNIYVCEALWRAKLSPKRQAGSLALKSGAPTARLKLLNEAIHDVIRDAIASGGSSLRDHIQTDGSLGYFQHNFAVYDREGEPCKNTGCGKPIKRMTQGGRSTFYCSSCQK